MFKRFLVLALALAFVSTVYAEDCTSCTTGACANAGSYTIMIISDSGFESMLDADGKDKAAGGKFIDETLVYFLRNAGFNVDTSGMGGDYRRTGSNGDYSTTEWWDPADTTGRKAALQAANLIIVSKFADSGSYARTEAAGANTTVAWNTLGIPILTQNAHLLRGQGAAVGGGSTKWGWTNGNNGRQYQGSLATDMGAVPVNHAAYSWLCPIQLFDYSGNVGNGAKDTNGDHDGREPDLPIGDWVPEATILGYLENDPTVWGAAEIGSKDIQALYDDPAETRYEDHEILVYIPAGTDFDAHNSNGGAPGSEVYGVAGADRAYFGIWSYDGAPTYYWGQDLTSCYKALFLNIVCDMLVPEPATIALLGLGGLALLRKRRNA